ncbi:MAG TPA: hypothetical protein VGX78_13535 [Pirellulales bacterium]|nr:hypothetical protein [Pirellulales bacterium]
MAKLVGGRAVGGFRRQRLAAKAGETARYGRQLEKREVDFARSRAGK